MGGQDMQNISTEGTLLALKDQIKATLAETPNHENVLLKDIFHFTKLDTQNFCKYFENFDSSEIFTKYCICMIVIWTSCFHNGECESFREKMKQRLKKIPQHAQRKYVETYANTFHTYGIDTFDIPITTLGNIEKIIEIHAGLRMQTEKGE